MKVHPDDDDDDVWCDVRLQAILIFKQRLVNCVCWLQTNEVNHVQLDTNGGCVWPWTSLFMYYLSYVTFEVSRIYN